MLTAIRDFVQDSFRVQKGDSLESLRFGELILWIEQGPQAILAGVIRGNAPNELRLVFQNALARIHLKQSRALKSFDGDGDTAPFAQSQQELEACLQARYESIPQKPSPVLRIALGTIALAVGAWVVFFIRDNLRWAAYLEKLNAEPGIVITNVKEHSGKYFVSGLRDPLAADPMRLMQAVEVNPKAVISQWKPYVSLEPALLTARAKQLLKPPETVSLKLDENGILSATGSAPHQWIAETRKRVQIIPGINQFQENNLIDTDLRQLESSKKYIEKQMLHFANNRLQLASGQNDTLQKLSGELKKLLVSARSLNKDVRVKIVGHADKSGSGKTNRILSQARAKVVLSTLVSKGFKPSNFEVVGVGSTEPLRNKLGVRKPEIHRSVSFKIAIGDRSK
jgi:OOP family OmpA-OmpF porin